MQEAVTAAIGVGSNLGSVAEVRWAVGQAARAGSLGEGRHSSRRIKWGKIITVTGLELLLIIVAYAVESATD